MKKNAVGFFTLLSQVSKFFEEAAAEEKEFSEHNSEIDAICANRNKHYLHNDDNSIVFEWRGY